MNSAVTQHRALLTDSIDRDLTMHRYREGTGGLVQYVGLWGLWLRPDGEPTVLRVLLATVTWPPAEAGEVKPARLRLGDLPWVVLQLQTIQADQSQGGPGCASSDLWPSIRAVLAPDIEAGIDAEGEAGCAVSGIRMMYDPKQRNEKVRAFRDEAVLQAYRIQRLDVNECDGHPVEVRPAVSLDRERVCYRVHNMIDGKAVPAPVTVFLEKTIPRQRMLWQCLQREAGYVRDGDLRGALGEAKTWIVLEG